jgi:uncharacterized sporulation protein YeaH/YhbH (DUF444 family)
LKRSDRHHSLNNGQTRHIVHDAAAKEATEEQFGDLRESGGTAISRLNYFNKMIDEEYDLEQWNIC